MKTNKIIITINNLDEIKEYKKIGITNFLFAVKDFSIGYSSFQLDELANLNENIFLLINRIMDTKSIENLRKIIQKLKFVKGIFFEDLGIYQMLKDTNIPLIYNQTQFATNIKSINHFLDKTYSAVISNSLCEDEIINIIEKVKKPIIFNVFAKNMAMYSRRKLLTNYNDFYNLKNINHAFIEETFKGKTFEIKEDDNGTVIFNDFYFNYLNILPKLNDNNILFYYINNLDLTPNAIKDLLDNKFNRCDDGFLNKKTIFKVGDICD